MEYVRIFLGEKAAPGKGGDKALRHVSTSRQRRLQLRLPSNRESDCTVLAGAGSGLHHHG